MRNLKEFYTLQEISEAFSLKTMLLETTSENKILLSSNSDDAVLLQIGWVSNGGFQVDTELADQAHTIHNELTKYFEGGSHDSITMMALSLTTDSYSVYGDCIDNETNPFSMECKTVTDLITALKEL